MRFKKSTPTYILLYYLLLTEPLLRTLHLGLVADLDRVPWYLGGLRHHNIKTQKQQLDFSKMWNKLPIKLVKYSADIINYNFCAKF